MCHRASFAPWCTPPAVSDLTQCRVTRSTGRPSAGPTPRVQWSSGFGEGAGDEAEPTQASGPATKKWRLVSHRHCRTMPTTSRGPRTGTRHPVPPSVREARLARLPTQLSPSRAKSFMNCPRSFYYGTILGLPSPATFETMLGTVCHTVFERVFDFPRGERTPELAVGFIGPAIDALVEPFKSREDVAPGSPEDCVRLGAGAYRDLVEPGSKKEQRLLRDAEEYRAVLATSETTRHELAARAHEMVRNWFTMENPNLFEPEGRELWVAATLAGVPMRGIIDRLDRQTHAGTDYWYISDYKSGKKPDPRYEEEAFFAMRVYAACLRAMRRITAYELRLIYVKAPGKEQVVRMRVTDQLLDRTERELKALWARIRQAAVDNHFVTRTGPLCNWCAYQDICPAFHPELEGMLPEEREFAEVTGPQPHAEQLSFAHPEG